MLLFFMVYGAPGIAYAGSPEDPYRLSLYQKRNQNSALAGNTPLYGNMNSLMSERLPLRDDKFETVPAFPGSTARGIFFSIGVGPRVPVFDFSRRSVLGYGFELELSYTDLEVLPVFLFGKIGFMQFPGSQEYYRETDITHYSMAYLPVSAGVRYYFAPITDVFFVVPIIEASVSAVVYQELIEYEKTVGRSNYYDDGITYGLSAGVGASMFLLDVLASYNYFDQNHFLSVDLKIRIPLYVIF